VHLVIRGHFWSRNKDGGHTIRSVIAENFVIHANLMVLSFIEPELWLIKVLQCERFLTFLLLWPWPWSDDLHIRTWPEFPGDTPDEQIWTSYVKSIKSYHLTDIYIQTDRTKIIHHVALQVVKNTKKNFKTHLFELNYVDVITQLVTD